MNYQAPEMRIPAAGPANAEQITADAGVVVEFAMLQATFALRGFELHLASDSTLIVARWGLCRLLSDTAAAREFLTRVGGRHA